MDGRGLRVPEFQIFDTKVIFSVKILITEF